MEPKLSIITPNFNKGIQTQQCVESVLCQSYKNFELIFIDDGSTDDSFENAIHAVKGDKRFVFLKNTTGIKGANAARNLGIEKSRGEYILFLDSDDIMTPDCLITRLQDIEKNAHLDFIAYPMGVFYDKIGDSDLISNIPKPIPDLTRFFNRDNPWLIAGPIWKKSALQSLKGFDLTIHSQQDNDLHVRAIAMGLKYEYRHRSPQVFYRQNTNSTMRSSSQSAEYLRQRFEMNMRHCELVEKNGKLDDDVKIAIARYILDIAQMMRWHIGELGKNALAEALTMWKSVYNKNVIPQDIYLAGNRYLRFKHTMFYNRVPWLQQNLEKYFRKKLKDYIHSPSTTLCNVTLNDYEP